MKIQHQKIHWYVYSCNVQSFYLNLNHFLLTRLARRFSHNNLDFEGISCTTSCPHKLHDRDPMFAFMNGDVWMYKYPGAYSKEFGELLPISFSLSQRWTRAIQTCTWFACKFPNPNKQISKCHFFTNLSCVDLDVSFAYMQILITW